MIESAVVKRILLMSPKTRRQTGSLLLSPISAKRLEERSIVAFLVG
jgi:hypothetical protein